MPFNVNQGDVQRALENQNTPSNYDGVVGSGSTTTSVVDSAGGWATNQWQEYAIQFTKSTNTVALQGKWQQITANTGNALALAAALPAIPAAGDTYNIRPFGQQTLNINSVGGTAQTGADWTTYFKSLWQSIVTLGSAISNGVAMLMAGSDGTNARALLVDTTGRLIAAKDLVALTVISNQAANTDFGAFTAPWSGTATVIITPATASVLNLRATISATEYTVGPVNSGVALAAGDPFEFDMPISSGIAYAFQFAIAQVGNTFYHVKGVAE